MTRLFMKLGKDILSFKSEKSKALLPFLTVNFGLSTLVDADRMDAAGLDFPKRELVSAQNVENYVKTLSQNSRSRSDIDPRVIKARDLLFDNLACKAMNMPLESISFQLQLQQAMEKHLQRFTLRLNYAKAYGSRYQGQNCICCAFS